MGLITIGKRPCQGMRGHRSRPFVGSGGFHGPKIPLRFASEPADQRRDKEAPMAVLGLGYAGFGSDALDDWRQFGTGLLGLQAVERGNSLLAFRMDDRKQRIVVDRALGNGARFFGWEVADAAALDALAAKLEAAGVARDARSRAALADAAPRARPDLVPGPRRQPARSVLRRRDRRHAVQARPQHLRLPHRAARPRPRRADGGEHRRRDGVLHATCSASA